MTAPRDPDRLIRAFLLEGEEQLQDRVYDAVRADIDHRAQRVVIGPWRLPIMNKILGFGLAAAAVVVAVLVGTQLFAPSNGGVGAGEEPTATPEPSVADPTPEPTPAWTGIPEGPAVVTDSEAAAVQVTVDVTAPGWSRLPGLDAITKNDDGLDSPETVGVALLGWSWPAGTGINVYADPCQWLTTAPETTASTPDEIATAFAAQALTEATEPVDVTVGGFAGKAITLQVPMSFHLPGATREEKFADCDDASYAFYGVEGEEGHARNAQGAGQIDDLWILDVEGSIVILDAAYGPATPDDLREELRTLAESATFEVP